MIVSANSHMQLRGIETATQPEETANDHTSFSSDQSFAWSICLA